MSEQHEWEKLVQFVQDNAGLFPKDEAVCLCLYCADDVALRLGMPGLIADALLYSRKYHPELEYIEDRLVAHLKKTRNYNLYARILREKIRSGRTDNEKFEALMAFGFFLQYVIDDHSEAVMQFEEALTLSGEHVLQPVIALHRLIRQDGACADAQSILELYCDGAGLSEDVIEELNGRIKNVSYSEQNLKSELLVEQSLNILGLYGDIDKAIDLLESGLDASDAFHDRIFGILYDIACASISHAPTLRRIREIMDRNENWSLAAGVARMEAHASTMLRVKVSLLIYVAQIYAEKLREPERAATCLHEVCLLSPSFFVQLLPTVQWPLACAIENAHFRNVLCTLVQETQNRKLILFCFDAFAAQKQDSRLRDHAILERLRILNRQPATPEEALKRCGEAAEMLSDENASELLPELLSLVTEDHCLSKVLDIAEKCVFRSNKDFSVMVRFIEQGLTLPVCQASVILLLTRLATLYMNRQPVDIRALTHTCLRITAIEPQNAFAQRALESHVIQKAPVQLHGNAVHQMLILLPKLDLNGDIAEQNTILLRISALLNSILSAKTTEEELACLYSAFIGVLSASASMNTEISAKVFGELLRVVEHYSLINDDLRSFFESVTKYPDIHQETLRRLLSLFERLEDPGLSGRFLHYAADHAVGLPERQNYLLRLSLNRLMQNPESTDEQLLFLERFLENVDSSDARNIFFALFGENAQKTVPEQLAILNKALEEHDRKYHEAFWKLTHFLVRNGAETAWLEKLAKNWRAKWPENAEVTLCVAMLFEKCRQFETAEELYLSVLSTSDIIPKYRQKAADQLACLMVVEFHNIKGALKWIDAEVQSGAIEEAGSWDKKAEKSTPDSELSSQAQEELEQQLRKCMSLGEFSDVLQYIHFDVRSIYERNRADRLIQYLVWNAQTPTFKYHLEYLQALYCEWILKDYGTAETLLDRLRDVPEFYMKAASPLVRVLHKAGKYARLVPLLEQFLTSGDLSDEQNVQMSDIYAQIIENAVTEPNDVFLHLKQACQKMPYNNVLKKRLIDYAEKHHLGKELFEALNQFAIDEISSEKRRQMLYENAELAKNWKLNSEVIRSLKMAFEIDPVCPQVLQLMEQVAVETGKCAELAEFYKTAARQSENPEVQIVLYQHIAVLFLRHIKDILGTFEVCCRIIQLDPDNVFALNLMEICAVRHERFDLLVQFYARLDAGKFPQQERSRRLTELIQTNANATHSQMLSRLACALAMDPANIKFMQAVAFSCKDNNDWEFVVRILLSLVAFTLLPDELYSTIVSIYLTKVNQPDKAFNIILNSLRDSTVSHEELFQKALGMADNAQKQAALQNWLDETIKLNEDSPERLLPLLTQRFQLAETMADNLAMFEALDEIFELYPSNPFAMDKIKSVKPDALKPYQQTRLVQLQIESISDHKQKLAKQFELAELYKKALQYNKAINLYHDIIDENPEFIKPRYDLVELLSLLENWKAAESELLRIIGLETDPNLNLKALIQLASIQCDKLLVPSRALLTLFTALDLTHRFDLIHPLLCEVSVKHRSFSPLIDKYQDIAEKSSDIDIKRNAIIHIARVYDESLDRFPDAQRTLETYLHGDGSQDLPFIQYLDEFYLKHDLYQDHIFCIAAELSLIIDNDVFDRMMLKFFNELKVYTQFSELADIFSRILLYYPNNMAAIGLMIEWANSLPQLMDAKKRLAVCEHLQSNETRFALRLKMMDMCLSQNHPAEALKILSEAMSFYRDDDIFYDSLQNILKSTIVIGDRSTFDVVFKLILEGKTGEPLVRAELTRASMLIHHFNDSTAASSLIHDLEPHFVALPTEKQPEITELIRQLSLEGFVLSATGSNSLSAIFEKKDPLHEKLEKALEKGLSVEAETICHEILAKTPTDPVACFNYIQLCYYSGKWDLALETLKRFLPVSDTLSPEEKSLLHYYYGDILHATDQLDAALAQFSSAIELQPDFRQAIDQKLTVLIQKESWEEALPVFEQLRELTEDNEVKGAILKRTAEVYHFFLKNPQKAIDAYEHALLLGGDVNDVPERLLELYRETKQWEKLILTATALAEANSDTPLICANYLRVIADTQNNELHNYVEADKKYYNMFLLSPFDTRMIHAWVNMLREHADMPALHAADRLKSVVDQLSGAIKQCQFEVLILLMRILKIIKDEPAFHKLVENSIRPILVRNVLNRVAQLGLKFLNGDMSDKENAELQDFMKQNEEDIDKLYAAQQKKASSSDKGSATGLDGSENADETEGIEVDLFE